MGTTAKEEGSNKATGKEKKQEEKPKPEPEHHPYAYHVSGPRHLSAPHWRDLFSSSWRNQSYRRIAMSCFVQVAYLLELDRQAKRTGDNCIAPRWYKQFKYKLVQTLVDKRDGSIYGAVLEWDHGAAMADFLVVRPWGAPRAAIALRGTILRGSTIRRDLEDDLRLVTWDCLKGSVRFRGTLEAIKAMVAKHGANNVCIGGHSLGAGFALQVGRELAKQGVFIECHLFNPPSLSVARGLKFIQGKAGFGWRRNRNGEGSSDRNGGERLPGDAKRWMPHLYINNSDYICCHYSDSTGNTLVGETDHKRKSTVASRLFLASRGPQNFLEAHGLQQWWSNDTELQRSVSDSKLLYRQLKSLYLDSASKKL